MHKVSLKNLDNDKFEASVEGQKEKLLIGAKIDTYNNEKIFKPKQLILIALGGCTALDVVALLKKMKLNNISVDIDVQGNLSKQHPIVYTEFKVDYRFKSNGEIEPNTHEKLWKIVELSQQRYCGVSVMLRSIGPVNYCIWLDGVMVFN